jgi:hypothetical protein
MELQRLMNAIAFGERNSSFTSLKNSQEDLSLNKLISLSKSSNTAFNATHGYASHS